MAHDVTDSRGRATSSRGSSARNSARVLTSRAATATRKYNRSSSSGGSDDTDDSYARWIEERIAKYNEAKRKSDALVNSMFGSVPTFNFNLTSNKSVEPNEAEEVNNTNNMQKEIDAARVTMRKTAYEKYMNNLLEKGQITREQYYDASLKVQEQENEKLTGKTVIKEKYSENTEEAYYQLVSENKQIKEVKKQFNNEGVMTETPEGTEAIIKPRTEDYEIITNNDGEVILKLLNAGKGSVYNSSGNAIGSVANIYMGSDGVDVKGRMIINGEEVEVRVVAGETDWGEEIKNVGDNIGSVVTSTAASATNVTIGYGKGILGGVEYLADGYLVAKSKVDSMVTSGVGKLLGFMGFEERKKRRRRSK